MAKNNNTNNNGYNLINPMPNRNNDTSSTPDTVLEKVADSLNKVNSGLDNTVKTLKDGFKKMSETDKKQNKELNTAIGKLTSAITNNTKSNQEKATKATKTQTSVEQRETRQKEKQVKAYEDFRKALEKLSDQVKSLEGDTSKESKRLRDNFNDLNQFFEDFTKKQHENKDAFEDYTIGADKFQKAIDNITSSYGATINSLAKKISELNNSINLANNEMLKNNEAEREKYKRQKLESEYLRKNAKKLLALKMAEAKAGAESLKLNKITDNLRYNSELRKSEFEAKSARNTQELFNHLAPKTKGPDGNDVVDLYSDESAKLMKSLQSLAEHQNKLEEFYINSGEKGPFYNEIQSLIVDLRSAIVTKDNEKAKIIEAALSSYEQSRKSAIDNGGNVGDLDVMVAYQNAENAKQLALNVKAQQELANKYISNYNGVVASLTNSLNLLETERSKLDANSEDYILLTKQIEETQKKLSGAISRGATIASVGSKLATGDIKTRSETMLDSIKPEQEELEKQRAVNYKELEEISKLKETDLSKEDKKELEAREAFLEKQNEALDNVQDQITQMVENIQKGNLKAASKNMQNINKLKKNLDEMEKGEKGLVDTIKSSFEEMKNNLKPQGTISKLISKGLKYVANEVINYTARLQTNALTELQNSYKTQGMDIAKTNLVTRKDVQRMMGDIGEDLESQGIKGIDTTDVMDMAESLANNGIRDQKVLKEMSIAMAKAGAMNPDMKATFGDIENIKQYQRIYDEAEKAGEDGAKAVEDYLMKAASEIYGITQVTGNAFAFTNGQLAELDSTIRESSRSLGLNTEQQDEYRKSVYSLAAVVGKDGNEFNSWLNDFVNLTEQGLSGDAKNVIMEVTNGREISDLLRNGETGEFKNFMAKSYSKLLTFDTSKNGGKYDEGHKVLMQALGISDEDLSKIRTNKDYLTNGQFDINKFLANIDKVYKATSNNDFTEKQNELLQEGQMQTVEESLESKAINNLTEHFVDMVGTDIPYIVEEETKAIDAAANLVKDVIDSGIDMLVGILSGNSLLGGGLGGAGGIGGQSVSGMWGSGALGKAGVIGAGVAAFSFGWDLGKKIDNWLGISEWAGKIDEETLEEYKKDEETRKKTLTAQEDAKTAVDTLTQAVNNNTAALGQKAKEIANSDTFKSKLASLSGAVKASLNENGSFNEDKINELGGGDTGKHAIQTTLKRNAQQMAGLATNTDISRSDFWNDYAVKMFEEQGLTDAQINEQKKYYFESFKKYDELKKEYDEFTDKYGGTLYDAWKRFNTNKKSESYKNEQEAWNASLYQVAGDDSGVYEHHDPNHVPIEGKDFKIEGSKMILLPNAYPTGDNDEFFAYAFNRIGKYATGLEEVPYDNYLALLHKGERVQTAAEVTQDNLQQDLNSNLEILNNNLANSNNAVVETFDDKQIVSSIESQTNDMSSLIKSALEILSVIANNTKYNYSTTNSSKNNYLANAMANRSTRLSDFKNPTMY